MNARFRQEQPVCVLAGHGERRAFYAGFLAWLLVDEISFESVALGPAQIHPQQHPGPILSVGPAGTGVDGDYRVARVVGTGKQHLGLGCFDLAFEPADDRLQFPQGCLIVGRKFKEDGCVFNIALELTGFVYCCL